VGGVIFLARRGSEEETSTQHSIGEGGVSEGEILERGG
jgi:hypothetical protein